MRLEVYIPNPESPDFYAQEIVFLVREAMIGKMFLDMKADYDRSHADGLISDAEYGRLLTEAYSNANRKAYEALPNWLGMPEAPDEKDYNHEPAAYGEG